MSKVPKHKLYDFELTPPAGVWDRIAHELDESDLASDYPARLSNLEVMPPASAWKSIEKTLDADTKTTPLPVRRIPAFIRYAVAAVILGMMIWAGASVLNKKGNKNEVTRNETPPVAPVTPTIPSPPITNDEITLTKIDSTEEETRNDAALENSKRTYAKLNVPTRSKIRNAADFHFSMEYAEPIPAEDLDPATRYVVLMTPDGHFFRMSKKLGDLVCCVSGEDQDKECVDQLKKWKNKMASSPTAYSSGNFGDILNLVKSLQE